MRVTAQTGAGAGVGGDPAERPGPSVPRPLVLLLAVACGAAAGNLYYAQPLLDTIARALHVGTGTAGLVVTLTQVGYALGLLFLVPLGDLLDRRRLVVTVLLGTTAALVVAASAPSVAVLGAALAVVGATSVVAQILVPFAATLAADHDRGRVVGHVMSGLLVGILLARTVAGLVAQAGGWRVVFVVAAVLMLTLALVLRVRLPAVPPSTTLRYPALLRSVGALVREEPELRRRMVYGALGFAAFGVFWNSCAFLLAGAPYHYNEAQIGLFGLAGVAGALCAQAAGRLADHGLARAATGVWLLLIFVSFGLLALGRWHLLPLSAGVIVLDAGVQGAQVTNQSAVYALRPAARSRLTTAYMTAYFAGGATGSATSAIAYDRWGWSGVCVVGAGYGALALARWGVEMVSRRRP